MAERDTTRSGLRLGFTVSIQHRRGLQPGEEFDFSRRLEDYVSERRLSVTGEPLCPRLWSAERSLNAVDQVELIEWLIADPIAPTVLLSPLDHHVNAIADPSTGWFRADVSDAALIPLMWLYSIRRISAEQYLHILGGFVHPVVRH